MPVTRSQLEAVVQDLRHDKDFRFAASVRNQPDTGLDVFAAVDDIGGFDPEDAGTEAAYLAWSRDADTAFVDGVLQKPIVLHWAGDGTVLQTAFSRQGLWVRMVRDAPPRPGFGWSGRLGLDPTSSAVTCDLLELFKAFGVLRKRGVVALENPGWTQSLGWESVNEVSPRKDRTAVFWQSQGHETAFDDFGQLVSPLHLYWAGDLERIASVLERSGFELERPDSSSSAIVLTKGAVESTPTLPALEEALTKEPGLGSGGAPREPAPRRTTGPLADLARFRLERKPVHRLAMRTKGVPCLAVAYENDQKGPPTHHLSLVDPKTGAVRRAFQRRSGYGNCGGCHLLADGRVLFSWYDFGEGSNSEVVLKIWDPSAEDAEIGIVSHAVSHVSKVALSAVDAAESFVATVTQAGLSIRDLAPIGAKPPAPGRPGVLVRKKAATPPKPWEETRKIFGDTEGAYSMVAVAPNGSWVYWGNTEMGRCFDRQTGEPKWQMAPFSGHYGARGISGIAAHPSSEWVAILTRRSFEEPGASWRDEKQLQLYGASDGTRSHPQFEERTRGVNVFAFSPDGHQIALGYEDGAVAMLRFPEGAELDRVRIFAFGAVTAIAFSEDGDRLVVGGSKGEVAVLTTR